MIVNSKDKYAVVTSSEAPSQHSRKVRKIRNISVTTAGESVQNLSVATAEHKRSSDR